MLNLADPLLKFVSEFGVFYGGDQTLVIGDFGDNFFPFFDEGGLALHGFILGEFKFGGVEPLGEFVYSFFNKQFAISLKINKFLK